MFQIPMIVAAFHILNSYALKLIVDTAKIGQMSGVIYPIGILIGIAALQEIVCRSGQWAFNKSQPFIRGEIITKAYEYVQNHSYNFFQNTHSGAITSKIKGIVSGYDDVFEFIWWKITNPLVMCLFGTLSLMFINFQLSLIVLAWCAVFMVVGYKMSLKLSHLSTQSNDLKHSTIGFIADDISNIFTIFAFATKKAELNKIKTFACGEVADLDYKKNLYQFKLNCVQGLIFISMIASVFGYTAYLRYINQISVGDFAYIVTIVYKIDYDIWALAEQVGSFFDTLGDFKSSFSILQTPQETLDKTDAQELII